MLMDMMVDTNASQGAIQCCSIYIVLTHWPIGDAEMILQMYFRLILRIDIVSTSMQLVLGEMGRNPLMISQYRFGLVPLANMPLSETSRPRSL